MLVAGCRFQESILIKKTGGLNHYVLNTIIKIIVKTIIKTIVNELLSSPSMILSLQRRLTALPQRWHRISVVNQ